jgi:EpsI family protein
MDFNRKIVLLSLLFVGVAIVVLFNGNSKEAGNDGVYETKRLSIPGWEETPIASSQGVLDSLQANITVFADYLRNGNEPVNLYIGFYDSLDKAKLSHAPQVCFTAQGWIMEKNDKIDIKLGGKVRKVNRLVLAKGTAKLLVYYWYQAGADVYDDLFRMKLTLLWEKIKNRNMDEGNAFVRISVPVSESLEKSANILQQYGDALFAELPKVFNRKLQQ